MQSRYAKFFQFLIIAGDLLLLNSCFVISAAVRFDEIRLEETAYYDDYLNLIVFFNISWLLLTLVFKTHDTRRTLEPRKATSKVFNVFFVHAFLLLLLLVSLKKDEYSRLFLIYFYASFFLTVLPWRFMFIRLLRRLRKKGLNFKKTVLIGDSSELLKFKELISDHPEYGLEIGGYFSDHPIPGIDHTGKEEDLEPWIKEEKIDEIYVAYKEPGEKLIKWFQWADKHLIRYRILPNLGLPYSESMKMDFYHNIPVLIHREEPLEYVHNRILKRVFDVIFSLLIILLIFPWLFPILVIGVKLSGKGPVFFKQSRSGVEDDSFTIFKFRSMKLNDRSDLDQAVEEDDRKTWFGKLIRQLSLDELPQFFNVLKGDMSICGPRPHMLAHTDEYKKVIEKYMVRHFAKPGITGLAQINGYRGEVKNKEDIEGRVRNDVYYIENWSLLLDLKIVLVTLFKFNSGS